MQADRDTAGCGERETTMAMTTTAAAGRTSASRAFRRPLVAAGLALAVGVGVAAPAAAFVPGALAEHALFEGAAFGRHSKSEVGDICCPLL